MRKSGNVVTVILGISTAEITTMNQTLEIGQVPSEFQPSAFIYGMIGLTLNNTPAYFAISPSRTMYIRVRGNIQANVALYASFTYVI